MMQPLNPDAPLPGDPLTPNRFIFGDAVDDRGIEESEYLVHTYDPPFICRILEQEVDFVGAENEEFVSSMLYDDESNVSCYACNDGVILTDFVFFGRTPQASELQTICDEAIEAYWAIDEAYRQKEPAEPVRRLRILKRDTPPTNLADLDAAEAASQQLVSCAQAAVQDPAAQAKLAELTQAALLSPDSNLLTSAQLTLLTSPHARERLLDEARSQIAYPIVERSDGSHGAYELWAIPLMYTVNHAGDNWYFPGLAMLEPLLREAYGFAEEVALHVSPTVINPDMLRETGCQSLIHIASALDADEATVPEDVDAMKQRYQEARQHYMPRLTLNWIIIAVAQGRLVEVDQPDPNTLLDLIMPAVEGALSSEIDYGEATLYQPEPLWQALRTGVEEYNSKRLLFTVSLLEKNVDIAQLRAVVEYQPQLSAFWLTLRSADDSPLSSFAWLVVPDLAPDRNIALAELRQALEQIGVSLNTVYDNLH